MAKFPHFHRQAISMHLLAGETKTKPKIVTKAGSRNENIPEIYLRNFVVPSAVNFYFISSN